MSHRFPRKKEHFAQDFMVFLSLDESVVGDDDGKRDSKINFYGNVVVFYAAQKI